MPEFGNSQANIVSYNVSYFLYMGKYIYKVEDI